jgi:hypothetical protein
MARAKSASCDNRKSNRIEGSVYEMGDERRAIPQEHWHIWSCGCKTRIRKRYAEIEYCRKDCLTALAFIGESD